MHVLHGGQQQLKMLVIVDEIQLIGIGYQQGRMGIQMKEMAVFIVNLCHVTVWKQFVMRRLAAIGLRMIGCLFAL